MSRRSLRPQLNQIRGWVRQGRTDAWIAHQLEVTVQQIVAFKRENDLAGDDVGAEVPVGVDFDDEIDLRAEDDALIAAELEAEQAKKAEEAAAAAVKAAEEAAARAAAGEDDEPESEDDDDKPASRRRGRRGRGRRTSAKSTLEGTFDHGEEGYGLWLDPAVEENAIYAEHWAGHRPVEVTIEADRIIIRRADTGDGEDDDS